MNTKRYGIFLRPDAATCWSVTQVTFALEQQFGLKSAAAFPPHATLIGNLSVTVSESEVIAALDPVFAELTPFPVYNSGVVRTTRNGYEYDVNHVPSGEVNEPLAAAASAVAGAVAPLSVPVTDYMATPVEQYVFSGHLGLASHELAVDGRLSDEVGEFIAELPLKVPASFEAHWYSLFEFDANWDTAWWEHMTWRHVSSWDVSAH